MKQLSGAAMFFVHSAKLQSILARKLDSSLGGLSLNEFIILFHLSQSDGEKMRRIDLADKLGLTASGITRLLLPMEKIGLVGREVNEHDARVSYVCLARGGKSKLADALERIEEIAEDCISERQSKHIADISAFIVELSRSFK